MVEGEKESYKHGPFGVALRGAGQVAHQYAAAVLEDPLLTLVGVSSRTLESAARFAEQYRTSKPLKVYPSYEDLLQDPEVQVVILCMPNYLHAREAALALSAGKHLIIEKPPVIAQEELELLRTAFQDASSRRPVHTVVSFVLRWHPLIRNIRHLLDSSSIGEIYYTEMDYWHGIKPS